MKKAFLTIAICLSACVLYAQTNDTVKSEIKIAPNEKNAVGVESADQVLTGSNKAHVASFKRPVLRTVSYSNHYTNQYIVYNNTKKKKMKSVLHRSRKNKT